MNLELAEQYYFYQEAVQDAYDFMDNAIQWNYGVGIVGLAANVYHSAVLFLYD